MIYSLVIDIQMKEAKKIHFFSLHNKKNGTSTRILLAQNDDVPFKWSNGPFPIKIHANFTILISHLDC